MVNTRSKVAIVGSGFVGSSSAFAMALNGLVAEVVLIDANKDKAAGEAMDINHGLPFLSQLSIYAGDYSDCKDCDIIVITAGANRKPGETRLDLAKKNVAILKDITDNVMKHYTQGVILLVSNPVDVLTYLFTQWSGLPAGRVIGTGTVLDSSRFRYLLGQHLDIDVRNIHGYVIGEHGDSQIPVWSATYVAGMKLDEYCAAHLCNGVETLNKEAIAKDVKSAGADIIKYKGATYYAIAITVNRIVEALLKDQNSIMTVSSLISGRYGIQDVALSLPSIINNKGVDRVLDIRLADDELLLLQQSAAQIRSIIDQVI